MLSSILKTGSGEPVSNRYISTDSAVVARSATNPSLLYSATAEPKTQDSP